MMRTISTLALKGGTAKTTVTTNVGHALAMRGQRVLLIDCCMQGNTSSLVESSDGPTLTDVLCERASLQSAIRHARHNLDIVPSDRSLDSAAKHIVAGNHKSYYILKRQIAALKDYDLVFYDHSPSYSAVTEAVLLASDEMLIPVELSPYAVDGMISMFQKLEDMLAEHTLALTGIVPVKLDKRIAMHDAYLREIIGTFGEKVYPAIRTDNAVPKAQSFHQTVMEHSPHTRSADDFRAVSEKVVAREEVLV